MQQIKTILWSTLFITLLTTIIAFMIPVPATWPLTHLEFYLPFAANTIMACLHVGAAVLFVTNLDVYKTKLRRAYIFIAIGTVISGLGTLQISIIAVLDAWRSAYVLGGGMMLPFLVAGLTLYFAVRQLTLLVGTKHLLTRAWLVLPGTLLIAYATSYLPHVPVTLQESAFDIGIEIIAWSAALMWTSCILVVGIRKQTGALYVRAMTWLAGAFFVTGLALVLQCVYYLITTDYDHIITRINNIVVIGSGLMWLRAGYAFALTKYYQETVPVLQLLFGKSDPDAVNRPKTVIDMVTYTAGLVSNATDIDPLLDKVRALTVKLKPGEVPSKNDMRAMIDIYLQIESYLTTREPARTFTKQEVRAQLDQELQKLIIAHETKA